MRRISLIVLMTLLLAPAAAWADRRASGDGSLMVSNANARVINVKGNGLIFGHIDQGTVTVIEYDAADTAAPQISGSAGRVVGNAVVYTGSDLRFLFPNGHYVLRLEGAGIDISAVGSGKVMAAGLGTLDDGSLAVNGGKSQDLGVLSVSASFGGSKSAATAAAPAGLARGH